MNTLIKKYIPMFLALFFYISCITSPSKDYDSIKKFNTTITIHYKNEADKKFTKFQQYDEFFLENYGIVAPPPHETENEKLKTTIKLNLDRPTLLLLGFDEFYIEPRDSLDIDFIVLKQTKTEYRDSIKINHGIGIVTVQRKRLFLNNLFAKELSKKPDKQQIENLVSEKALINQVDRSFSQLYSTYPTYKNSKNVHDFFQNYFKQYYFASLGDNLNIGMKKMSDNIKSITKSRLKTLSVMLSREPVIKSRTYWYGMNKVFEQVLNPEFQKALYSYHSIQPLIKDYDSITQQFFLLLSIRADYSLETKNDIVQKNLDELIEHITYTKFIPYIEKFKHGNSTSDFINDDIRKCLLFDSNMQPISFNDIFKNSLQKHVYLDFCGTWCKPCMDEIAQYSIHKKFDTSAIVKPIWLFF